MNRRHPFQEGGDLDPGRPYAERRADALAHLDLKVAELRAELSHLTEEAYARMQPHERRFIDSARRALAEYDAATK